MNLLLRFLTSVLLFYVLDGNAYKLEIKAELTQNNRTVKPMDYLFEYGYFPGYCSSKTCKLEEERKKKMIKDYQSFANLEETGIIDAATVRQMHVARCSNKDKKFPGFTGRPRRYNPQGTVWDKVKRGEPLTWRYAKPNAKDSNDGITEDLSRPEVRRILDEATKKWSDVAEIEFKEIDENAGEPDIWIYFGAGDHGDIFPFDGPAGTLAHAFYPLTNKDFSGDMHFDDDEMFTTKTSQGRNLLWVATHELGHSIGLAHSNIRDAVMYPYYTGYQPNFQLRADDIDGIRSIYGEKTKSKPKPTPKPTPSKPSCPADITAMCLDPENENSNKLLTATGGYTFDNSGNIQQTTTPLLEIDAAFTGKIYADSTDEFMVVFSGASYSVYTKDGELKSEGHSIHKLRDENGNKNPLQLNFPTSVKAISAALKWQRNSKLYLYYRYNEVGYYRKYDLKKHRFYRTRRRGTMDWKTASRWRGLPKAGPDAAISSKKLGTYFVVGNNIYKYNDRRVMVNDGYPKPIATSGFFQCE